MNEQEAKALVDELFACYPNAPTVGRRRREVVTAWYPSLRVVRYDDGQAAVRFLAETSTFVPSLAEVLVAVRIARRDRLGVVTASDREPDVPPEGGYLSLAEWKAQRKAGA